MHRITILGIVLIAAGTILVCFGQNIRNRFVDKHLHQSISEKPSQIDELVNSKNELLARINKYQKRLTEKDEIIQRLEAQVNESIVHAPKQPADEQIETGTQAISEADLSDVIVQAKGLCNEGRYDEAYKIADDLRRKNPDLGQAYFVLGTIEMRKERYSKGVELLNQAIHLKLPSEDTAWAFHNLGIASLRKKDYGKAQEFFEKAVELNSNMEKSKSALKLLNDYLQTIYGVTQARNLYNEGKYDDAYRIADGLREKSPATISSKRHELKDIKTLPPFQLDFRLVGTIIAGNEISYAVIEDETTGKHGMYKLGQSINEATVLKIDKESIIVEKDGKAQVLKIIEGSYAEAAPSEILSGDRPPSIGVSEELPYFEPVLSETGPPVDENVLVKELPRFERITNNTGPPVDENMHVEEFPHFEPITYNTGLPVDENMHVEELPHFKPITNNTSPPVDDEDFREDSPGFIPFKSDSGPPGMPGM